jgi:magnesium transporter
MSTVLDRTSVSALLGKPVMAPGGALYGHVRECAVAAQVDDSIVQALVVRKVGSSRKSRPTLVPVSMLIRSASGALEIAENANPTSLPDADEKQDYEQHFLMLERDLLDQQIIDVHGHKVVRVNDVDLIWEAPDPASDRPLKLRIAEVEVGFRGAMRRLLKGLPPAAIEGVASRLRSNNIPWKFVDTIDRDPARRVRLKIEQEQLSRMHPSDLADILEELAPAEGQALFESLDEETAAETLEEVELKTRRQLIESLDSERAAGIIEEMDPGAAADLLSQLTEERSDAILEEMGEKERHDLEELLEYQEDSAAGLMTTEFLSIDSARSVGDAVDLLRSYEGDAESVTDLFLIDPQGGLKGVIPLALIMLASRETSLAGLHDGHMVSSRLETGARKVAELFDKYNLRCLPVLDENRHLAGIIQAEHVIAWLRNQ